MVDSPSTVTHQPASAQDGQNEPVPPEQQRQFASELETAGAAHAGQTSSHLTLAAPRRPGRARSDDDDAGPVSGDQFVPEDQMEALGFMSRRMVLQSLAGQTPTTAGENATDTNVVSAASAKPPPPYRYVDRPPVRTLTFEETVTAAKSFPFRKSIAAYITDRNGEAVTAPQGSGELAPTQVDADAWQARGSRADSVAEEIIGDRTPAVVYELGSETVAMMILSPFHDDDVLEVEMYYLATHPGVYGAGEAMVEEAVNRSQKMVEEAVNRSQKEEDCHGKIKLDASSPEAEEFYKSLGFISLVARSSDDQLIPMFLNPSESDYWENKDGTWVLKKNLTSDGRLKKYLAASEDIAAGAPLVQPKAPPVR